MTEYKRLIDYTLTGSSLSYNVQIHITQTIEDLGLYEFIENYDILSSTTDTAILAEDSSDTINLGVLTPSVYLPVQPEYVQPYPAPVQGFVTGATESRVDEIRTWGGVLRPYDAVEGIGLLNEDTEFWIYVIGGVFYTTSKLDGVTLYAFPTNNFVAGNVIDIFDNTTLPMFKRELYLGQVEKPIVNNQVFIERTGISVFDKVNKISNINFVEGVEDYQNGEFPVVEN